MHDPPGKGVGVGVGGAACLLPLLDRPLLDSVSDTEGWESHTRERERERKECVWGGEGRGRGRGRERRGEGEVRERSVARVRGLARAAFRPGVGRPAGRPRRRRRHDARPV